MSEYKASNNFLNGIVTVDGELNISGSSGSDILFRVSSNTNENFLVCDASSSDDGLPRVTLRAPNDRGGLPSEGPSRGLLHIELNEGQSQNSISCWSLNSSDPAFLQLSSWSQPATEASTLSFQTCTAGYPNGGISGTQTLGYIDWTGYDSGEFDIGARIKVRAGQNWTGSGRGTFYQIYTTKNNTTSLSEIMRWSDGIVMTVATELTDGQIFNSSVTPYLDEVANKLWFKVKYSNGTVKSGSIDLS